MEPRSKIWSLKTTATHTTMTATVMNQRRTRASFCSGDSSFQLNERRNQRLAAATVFMERPPTVTLTMRWEPSSAPRSASPPAAATLAAGPGAGSMAMRQKMTPRQARATPPVAAVSGPRSPMSAPSGVTAKT